MTERMGRAGVGEARAAIEESYRRFSEAVRSRDPERVGAFYSEDAVLLVGSLPAARGRDQITAWFAEAFAAGLTELTFETGEIRSFSPVAVEEGDFRMVVADRTQRGRYVVVHQCDTAGVWRVLYDVVQPG